MRNLQLLVKPGDPILSALHLGPHQFPGIWNYMMPHELLSLKLPEERRATCMSCPKACYDGYRPDYRCCTYHPRVPSFLLGLATLTPAGQGAVERLLAKSVLLPEGMHYAPAQWIDYLDDLQHEDFGKSQKVLCPNLEPATGYCMIHAFRNSVCSTFFCYKDHGDLGDQFWGRVQTLGSQLEMAIGQWSLEMIGFDLPRYFKTFDRLAKRIKDVSLPEGWRADALEELWGPWAGREIELLQETAGVVLEHREKLWDIGNSYPIRDSRAFDRAMVRAVPKRLEDQIDPEDRDEDEEEQESAKPRDLWLHCLKTYHKLWELPDGYYHLNPRVSLEANAGADRESGFYALKAAILNFHQRKDGKSIEWRQYISLQQRELLELFTSEARQLDWRFLLREDLKDFQGLKEFLSEMLAQKVLVKRTYH